MVRRRFYPIRSSCLTQEFARRSGSVCCRNRSGRAWCSMIIGGNCTVSVLGRVVGGVLDSSSLRARLLYVKRQILGRLGMAARLGTTRRKPGQNPPHCPRAQKKTGLCDDCVIASQSYLQSESKTIFLSQPYHSTETDQHRHPSRLQTLRPKLLEVPDSACLQITCFLARRG